MAVLSLIQLSSFGGCVILFRSCFFHGIPKQLQQLLESNTVVKVGQGLEKDKMWLMESFGVSLNSYLDIRKVCCKWPYFTAHFSFDKFGAKSVGEWMDFDLLDYSWPQLSPYWVTKRLEEDQIRVSAEQVQLYVDVFTFTVLRYLGQIIPRNWMTNEYFHQVLFHWCAVLLEKPFLNSKFMPKVLKACSVTASKRDLNHDILKNLKNRLPRGAALKLATLWAWPLPANSEELEKMLTHSSGRYLPSCGYPFVALNPKKFLANEEYSS